MNSKQQIRRLSCICQVLNDSIPHVILIESLRRRVSEKMDIEYCRSTIEKDLYFIREELDVETKYHHKKGVSINSRIDFLEAMKNYLNIFT